MLPYLKVRHLVAIRVNHPSFLQLPVTHKLTQTHTATHRHTRGSYWNMTAHWAGVLGRATDSAAAAREAGRRNGGQGEATG